VSEAQCITPELLGLSAHRYAEAVGPSIKGGRPEALRVYSRVFREGGEGPGFVRPRVVGESTSESPDGVVTKFLLEVPPALGARTARPQGRAEPWHPEHLETESVLIPMVGRKQRLTYTLCVSSQVGCAMGCTFCETAQMGLIRHLTAGEIVAPWWAATHILKHTVSNIVFMGMGEPLDNFDNVIQAITVLADHRGAGLPTSKITISTVGRLDGLARLKEKIAEPGWHRLNLAVSLNAPSDEVRSGIMPINRGMPMGDLQRVLIDWPQYGGGKICVEYVLIPGVNDAPEHVREIAEFLKPINARGRPEMPRCLLNLIPYNPRRNSPWPAPEEEHVDRFLAALRNAGVYAKRRRTKGRDMMGACGQLGNERIRKRRFVEVGVVGRGG
jgi:23S rRNA (adenine2503-C2)-methyltransferase